MRFEEAIGQETISQELIKNVLANNLGHSLLFLGAEGCGNLTMALALSQMLVCKNPGPNGSCGNCISCGKAAKMVHPDIHYSFPFVKPDSAKTESIDCSRFIEPWREMILDNPYHNDRDWFNQFGTKNGNINHNECRNVIQKLMLKAYEGGRKVWILWYAEYLASSGNILLKLIEEPPPGTFIILVASNSQKIPDTVLSRTQKIRFPMVSEPVVEQYLIDQKAVKQEDARSIASLVSGNLNRAIKMGANEENREQALLIQWITACLSSDITDINEWVEGIVKEKKESQKGLLEYALHIIQLSIKSKYLNTDLSHDQLVHSLVLSMNNHLEFDQMEKVVVIFEKAQYYLQRNANARLLFYNLSLQFSRQLKANPTLA